MQIHYLHKNIYKLYAYARSQECLDAYRQHYETDVNQWKKLKSENVSDNLCQEVVGFSRSTFYRRRNRLKDLEQGILPPSKKPRKLTTIKHQ